MLAGMPLYRVVSALTMSKLDSTSPAKQIDD